MRTGTVIALHVGGLGNNIFNCGQTVSENNFPPDNFDRLIAGGFVKENKPNIDTAPAQDKEQESDSTRTYKTKK